MNRVTPVRITPCTSKIQPGSPIHTETPNAATIELLAKTFARRPIAPRSCQYLIG